MKASFEKSGGLLIKPMVAAVLAASAALSGQVNAADDTPGLGLEEVIVTAQKREQSFQDLAVSAAVLSAGQLDAKGITQVQDALKAVPGVKLQTVAGTGSGRVFIRGIGTSSGDEFDSIIANGVSLNLDGVTSNNASNTLGSMFDVERVEVLKGPQGTLYGSGALGGVVNVITARPKLDEFEGEVRVQYGNYDQKVYQGMLNIPLGDTLALRITGTSDERDGYTDKPGWLNNGWQSIYEHEGYPFPYEPFEGLPPGVPTYTFLLGLVGGVTDPAASKFGNYGAQENEGYRVKGLWAPSDNLSVMVTYEYQEQQGTSPTWIHSDSVRDGELECCELEDPTGVGALPPPSFATPQWYEQRYFYRESETWTADIAYRFDGFADLTFTASMNEIEDLGQELTATQLRENDSSEQEQDIYELRLSSLPDSDIVWVVGLYLQETDRTWANNPSSYPPSTPGAYRYRNGGKPFENKNIYGQITYPLSDDLRLTAGLRYSETTDEIQYSLYKSANPCPSDFPFCPAYDDVVEEHFYSTKGDTQDKLTWKIGFEYDLAEDNLLYAHVATGFKAGGVQPANTTAAYVENAPIPLDDYDPEESISFEIGSKNRFYDDTLQVNAALFYTEWDNMQVNTLVCSVPGCSFAPNDPTYIAWYNADVSTQYGLELDVVWLPYDNGRVSLTSAFIKGEYGETNYPWAAPGFGGIVNLDGNEMANTPSYAGTLSYTHTFPLSNGHRILATIEEEFSDDYQVTHEYWWMGATQGSYTRTNLSLAYQGESFDINIYARNLEEETTIQSVFPFGVQSSDPRVYGASVSYRF